MTIREFFNLDPFTNPYEDNRWGGFHIAVLLICIAICVATYFLKNRDRRLRVWIIRGVAIALLAFELTRRVIGLIQMNVGSMSFGEIMASDSFWYHILPRPWCAISVWLIILAAVIDRDFFYNIASMNAIICVIIFFAYPTAGFNNEFMQFENVYSITTHALLLVGSVSMITMGLTDFKYTRTKWYNSALRELVAIVCVLGYALLQVFVLKIQHNADPMYFMPTGSMEGYVNEVQAIVGLSGPLYVLLYSLFLAFYFNLFFLIQMAVDKKRAKKDS